MLSYATLYLCDTKINYSFPQMKNESVPVSLFVSFTQRERTLPLHKLFYELS